MGPSPSLGFPICAPGCTGPEVLSLGIPLGGLSLFCDPDLRSPRLPRGPAPGPCTVEGSACGKGSRTQPEPARPPDTCLQIFMRHLPLLGAVAATAPTEPGQPRLPVLAAEAGGPADAPRPPAPACWAPGLGRFPRGARCVVAGQAGVRAVFLSSGHPRGRGLGRRATEEVGGADSGWSRGHPGCGGQHRCP